MSAQQQMTPERKRLVRRIANLLKLGRGEGHEADTARLFAKKLMLQHGIDVVLGDSEETPDDKPKVDTRAVESENKPSWWRFLLLKPLSTLYGCDAYATQGEDKRKWFLWLTGETERVHKCAVHYELIVSQIADIAAHSRCPFNYSRERWEEGICCGAFQSILERLGITPDAGPPGLAHLGFTMEVTPERRELVSSGPQTALVLSNQRQRIEYETEGVDDDPQVVMPTVVLDPPQRAIKEGRRIARFIQHEPPAICFGTVEQLTLDRPTVNVLQDAGLRSVYALMRMRPRQLRAVDGVGRHRFSQIVSALSEWGLLLRQDW